MQPSLRSTPTPRPRGDLDDTSEMGGFGRLISGSPGNSGTIENGLTVILLFDSIRVDRVSVVRWAAELKSDG
jgi:hypothetical protein